MVGRTLHQHKSPMEEAYHPELDDLPLLPAIKASQYPTLIGMANWMIILGWFDIHYATMALSQYNMAPQEGYSNAMLWVHRYLQKHAKGRILVDDTLMDLSQYPVVNYTTWHQFYPDAIWKSYPMICQLWRDLLLSSSLLLMWTMHMIKWDDVW